MMTDVLIGAWTPYSDKISEDTKAVFDKVFSNFVGVSYSPLAVSSQIVSGTNFSFFCNAKGVYPDAPNEAAIVQIYCPLDGDAHITSIKRI